MAPSPPSCWKDFSPFELTFVTPAAASTIRQMADPAKGKRPGVWNTISVWVPWKPYTPEAGAAPRARACLCEWVELKGWQSLKSFEHACGKNLQVREIGEFDARLWGVLLDWLPLACLFPVTPLAALVENLDRLRWVSQSDISLGLPLTLLLWADWRQPADGPHGICANKSSMYTTKFFIKHPCTQLSYRLYN